MVFASNIRLYINTPLERGAHCVLSDNQCNYLKNVMRLNPGDVVKIFNGSDGEWHATIGEISKKSGYLLADNQLRAQTAEPDVWLIFAPIKHGRIDWLIEKATELGAVKLLPVFTKHTIVNRVNTKRLAAHAIEAAEQSERLSVPEVLEADPLDALLKNWNRDRKIILCDESGAGKPVFEALQPFRSTTAKWAIMIGPEGGFSKQELEKLRSLPHVLPVSLGPRVLRADTAALSALSCWQALLGDWQEETPSFRGKE